MQLSVWNVPPACRFRLSVDYAAAWAGLARDYYSQAGTALHPIDEGYRLAREAANRALAIDPEYAPAYAQLGYIAIYHGDLAAAALVGQGGAVQ